MFGQFFKETYYLKRDVKCAMALGNAFFSVCFLLKIRADSCDFDWLFYTLSFKGFSPKNVQILNNFVVLHHILNYFFLLKTLFLRKFSQ